MKSSEYWIDDVKQGSHPSRGVWIEMRIHSASENGGLSHPSRGAWIEIPCGLACCRCWCRVAPLTGCVD